MCQVLISLIKILCWSSNNLNILCYIKGMSNGGMFIWTRIMERLAATVASAGVNIEKGSCTLWTLNEITFKRKKIYSILYFLGTVCSSPLRGYNPMPDSPVNIIDFHGLQDNVIPYSPESPGNLGEGPDMTTETNDGYYYHIKPDHLTKVKK